MAASAAQNNRTDSVLMYSDSSPSTAAAIDALIASTVAAGGNKTNYNAANNNSAGVGRNQSFVNQKRSDSPNPSAAASAGANGTSGGNDLSGALQARRHHCPHKHRHHHNHPRASAASPNNNDGNQAGVGLNRRTSSATMTDFIVRDRVNAISGITAVMSNNSSEANSKSVDSGLGPDTALPAVGKPSIANRSGKIFGEEDTLMDVNRSYQHMRPEKGDKAANKRQSGRSLANTLADEPRSRQQQSSDLQQPNLQRSRSQRPSADDEKAESGRQGPTVSDLWPGHWGAYDGHPERDSLDGNVPSGGSGKDATGGSNGPGFSTDPDGGNGGLSGALVPVNPMSGAAKVAAKYRRNNGGKGRNGNNSRKMSDAGSKFDFKGDKKQPKPWIWVTLSAMYGKLIVLLAFAFCLTEVMDNDVGPLQYQGIFVMYLYVASIVAIMCIYITVLVDQFPSLTNSRSSSSSAASSAIGLKGAAADDPEAGGGGGASSTGNGGGGSAGSTLTRGWSGTLRRAHISRSRISRTSFYLRIGAIVFGLGTLVFTGLEIAMHTTRTERCVPEIIFAHPILQALFTFLQMHFLFVNSEVIVEKWGAAARFGLMHLVATNLALWVRLVVYESVNDLIRGVYGGFPPAIGETHSLKHAIIQRDLEPRRLAFNGPSYDQAGGADGTGLIADVIQTGIGGASSLVSDCFCDPTASLLNSSHVKQVIGLYECLNNNTLGQIWTNSMSHLFPFIVEYRLKVEIHFSLIAAAVTYVMWKNVGKAKVHKELGLKAIFSGDDTLDARKRGHFKVDCQSSSKGLFLGLLCLVGGIVVLIIFYVMKEHIDEAEQLYLMYGITQVTIVSLGTIAAFFGLFQLPRLSLSGKKPMDLDRLLASTAVIGVYIFAIFGVIVGLSNVENLPHSLLVGLQAAQILQVTLQGLVITDAARRMCATRHQMLTKPGRQVITFLVFANATLWLMDTFMAHDAITQGLQARFFGFLAWGVISRISVPLVVFYRFYSTVALIEIWKNTYKTKTD